MKMKFSLAYLVPALFFLSLSPAPVRHIEGVVIEQGSSAFIANAYLYIVKGEEEALSDSGGRFMIRSSEKFPLTVYVQSINHEPTSFRVDRLRDNRIILKKKP